MDITKNRDLEKHMLGAWVKVLRTEKKWSQEALAAAANIDVRTIQRFENGRGGSVVTKRALARALGYGGTDVFDDPDFLGAQKEFWETIEITRRQATYDQYPEMLPINSVKIRAEIDFEKVFASEAKCFHFIGDISQSAREVAAEIFGYVEDAQDIIKTMSYVERWRIYKELDGLRKSLENENACLFYGCRDASLMNDSWAEKTPLKMRIAYVVVVVSNDDEIELLVPKTLSFGM